MTNTPHAKLSLRNLFTEPTSNGGWQIKWDVYQALAIVGDLLLEQLAGEHVVKRVPALVRHDPPTERPAHEEQVADQIERLVAGAFVDEPELVLDRPGGRYHQ